MTQLTASQQELLIDIYITWSEGHNQNLVDRDSLLDDLFVLQDKGLIGQLIKVEGKYKYLLLIAGQNLGRELLRNKEK